MSERKVLNKYYPPDFDPTKIPKLRQGKNGNFGIRLMAPFNMRCNTCGEYIYKGKKFNSQKETVANENYLGLHIFRFYIKCPRCIAVIVFKTDPVTTDYILEAGATRNFEAMRTAELMAIKEQKEKEEELKNNPMKVLENRSLKSQQEIEMIETLEELRHIRKAQNDVKTEMIIEENKQTEKQMAERLVKQQEEEDEAFIRSVFRGGVKRLRPEDMLRKPEETTATISDANSANETKSNDKISDVDSTAAQSQSRTLKVKGLQIKIKKRKLNEASDDNRSSASATRDPSTVVEDRGASTSQRQAIPTAAQPPPPPPLPSQPSALGGLVGYNSSGGSDEDENDGN